MELTGATAIVSGGASGLGAATARALAEGGAHVTILDLQEEAGTSLAREIGGSFIRTDVTSSADVARAVSEAGDPLRVAVNCAGVATPGRIVGRDGAPLALESFRTVVAINLIGTFNVLAQAAAAMAATEPLEHGERGVIINTASVAAYEGQIGQAAYAASKAGVLGLTLPAARDLAGHGIRVNAIAPGIIDTPMLAGITEEFREALSASVPFPKRLGQPAEYASLVLEIVRNGYLNGETIRMDGALRMGPR
jgi:NAD(P)-dependent dehydrogenase (short-subunit alcohol dehydrogenase family)